MALEFQKNAMYVSNELESGDVQKNFDDDGREKRTGTLLTASAHIITAVIGSGVLSLAWAIAQLGWVAGPAVLFAFSFITYFTSTLLADSYRSPGPISGKRNYTYMDVVRSHLGGAKVTLCGIAQYANLVGVTIGYTITASISMVAVKRSNCFHKNGHEASCSIESYPYMIIFAVIQIVLSQIPNFHKLSWLSILAAVMSFAYASIGLGLSIAKAAGVGHHVKTSLTGVVVGVDVSGTEKVWRSFQAIGDIAFAYAYSTVLIEIQDTLRSSPPESKVMKRASLAGVSTTTLFYVLCGTIGYAAFGNNAPGNFLTGFGFYEPFWLIDFANVCIAIHLIGAYQMSGYSNYPLLLLAVILLLVPIASCSHHHKHKVKTAVYHSPKFVLKPGLVANNFYYNIDFPKGHVAIKDFHAEVVDEEGHSVPLYEVYLHHWVVVRYYQRKSDPFNNSDIIVGGNSGMCEGLFVQHFGLGSETRKTTTYVPDPYGIEIGNPKDMPEGYEERWVMNVHAIDTRGAEDRFGCIECRCNLYNVTKDEDGHDIKPDYYGGLQCCRDKTRCRLRKGYKGPKKGFYLKYTVKYVHWHAASIVPVKIYIIDVIDSWKAPGDKHLCQLEYSVEPCSAAVAASGHRCTDTKKLSIPFPTDGDIIYGVSHQHKGAFGSTLHREDGRLICSSHPIYGKGKGAGNEAGFVVGMSTCYPKPGSMKLKKGETVTLVTKYNSSKRHAGVMGLFYILVAEPSPKPDFVLHP